jgi:hypothetical protein
MVIRHSFLMAIAFYTTILLVRIVFLGLGWWWSEMGFPSVTASVMRIIWLVAKVLSANVASTDGF